MNASSKLHLVQGYIQPMYSQWRNIEHKCITNGTHQKYFCTFGVVYGIWHVYDK